MPLAPPAGSRRGASQLKTVMGTIALTEEERVEIEHRIAVLELEHGDLDDIIDRLAVDPGQDQLQLRRLKKRKLFLKDMLARLRDRLIPDILA